MKKGRKIIIRLLLFAVLAVIIYLVGVILYGTATNYEPQEKEPIDLQVHIEETYIPDTLDFMIWNIGYSGLGQDMDFFYDGGEGVEPKKEWFDKYLQGILNYLKGKSEMDFILLQEVDKDSDRSYHTNEMDEIQAVLPTFEKSFALNYNVEFVPLPFTNPLGKTYGGLGTFTRHAMHSSERVSFPGNYDWPKSVFMLDRCFMVTHFPASNGKDLIVINTHNSAYDDGTLKAQQMDYLKNFITEEYEKGNFVVVGGDWNQNPPNYVPQNFAAGGIPTQGTGIAFEYLPPEWRWAYDPMIPTNRNLAKAYDPHSTQTNIIDFYLVSPNVKILEVKAEDLGFQWSDHQPVKMKIALETGQSISDSTQPNIEND